MKMDNWYDNGGFLQKATLDWHKAGTTRSLSGVIFRDRPSIVDDVRDEMRLVLEAFVLGEKLPAKEITKEETVTMDFPASPWQFFKEKHSSAWWLRWFVSRWPAQFIEFKETVSITAVWDQMEIYPENTLNAQLGKPVVIVSEPRVSPAGLFQFMNSDPQVSNKHWDNL